MKNYVGKKFGRLRVIKDSKRKGYVECVCDCGNRKTVWKYSLWSSRPTRSCGCLRSESSSKTGKRVIEENSRNFLEVNAMYDTNFHVIENTEPRIDNTSGKTGVSYNKRAGKWESYIQCQGKKYRLGKFKSFNEAVAAREAAESVLFEPLIRQKRIEFG